jgi:hypothetical protein
LRFKAIHASPPIQQNGNQRYVPHRLIGYRTSHCEAKVAPVVGKIAIGLFAYAFSRTIQPRDKTAPVSCDCSYRPGGEIIQCIGASGTAVFASLGSIDGDLSKAFSG